MKRCKICHVEAELTDGRCHSCQMAKEATDHGMTYGKYVAMIEAKRSEPKPMPKKTPDTLTSVCKQCGKEFPKFGARKYCSDQCKREHDYEAHKARMPSIEPQKCPVCHKIFIPKRRGVIYCRQICCDSKAAKYIRWEAKKNDRSRVD